MFCRKSIKWVCCLQFSSIWAFKYLTLIFVVSRDVYVYPPKNRILIKRIKHCQQRPANLDVYKALMWRYIKCHTKCFMGPLFYGFIREFLSSFWNYVKCHYVLTTKLWFSREWFCILLRIKLKKFPDWNFIPLKVQMFFTNRLVSACPSTCL